MKRILIRLSFFQSGEGEFDKRFRHYEFYEAYGRGVAFLVDPSGQFNYAAAASQRQVFHLVVVGLPYEYGLLDFLYIDVAFENGVGHRRGGVDALYYIVEPVDEKAVLNGYGQVVGVAEPFYVVDPEIVLPEVQLLGIGGAGLVFAAAMLALFVYGCICAAVNLTVLFFAAFLFAGALGGKGCEYLRIRADYAREMKKGMEVRRIAVREDCTFKRLFSLLERGKYAEFIVYDAEGEYLGELSEEEFCALAESAGIYEPIGAYLAFK